MLSKLEKFNHRVSGWFERLGMAGLLLMVVITFIDVVGAKLFTWRLPGALDIVMVSQAIAIAFAAAMLLILDRHVQVTFIVDRMPRRSQAITNIIIHFLELGLFILIVWRLFVFGHYMQVGGEGTGTIRIPLCPFGYGMAVALIPVCLVIILRLVNSLARAVGR
jgi:TRAP-type C4-dicarboxylate transport system permease small subunit